MRDVAGTGGDALGFRLRHFELFNWGTFDQRVWRLAPGGKSILLTGDIGSGKSTLVDALTTLLVAPHKLAYNKAAGADAHERSLRSYVLGHYKSERADTGSGTRAVALRDHGDYSVLLAVFADEASGETVTLAQVFWMSDPRNQPERLFVVADAALSVSEHFAQFGSDIGQLRKRLRATAGVTLHETFVPYGADFRRRFGIRGEQAMDLFHQAVSMKSVGNLTEFVREHMLEPFAVEARLASLVASFDELHRAHDAVLAARAQIEQLGPLVAQCERHAEQVRQANHWRDCRDALSPWFAQVKRGMLERHARELQLELAAVAERMDTLAEERRDQRLRRDALVEAIATNGGNRIGQLGTEIARLERSRDERAARAQQYNQVAAAVGLPAAAGAATFAANRRAIEDGRASCARRRDDAATRLTEAGVAVRELGRQHGDLTAELESLRRRSSNIPRRLVELRATLCDSLRIAPDALPFAGELIQVRENSAAWEGAAERVLRDFATALLVPDVHCRAVSEWAGGRHAGTQLAWYRVRPGARPGQRGLHAQSLVRHLAVKPETPHYNWLLSELEQRFDYACCDDETTFHRERAALRRDGHVKSAGERHEKDDRHRIDDRAAWVLGWTNEAKIATLAKQERDLATRIQAQVAQVSAHKRELDEHNAMLGHWQQLAMYGSFKELDWKASATMIEQFERERQELSTSADMLGDLKRQLDALAAEQDATESAQQDATGAHARLQEKLLRAAGFAAPAVPPAEVAAGTGAELDALKRRVLGDCELTIDSCDRCESDMRALLQTLAEEGHQQALPLRDAVIGAMQEYVRTWPLDTREVDVSVEAAPEFARMLGMLQAQELPRSLARFEQLLNEDTVRGISGLHTELQRERELVHDRIAAINGALRAIDYNPGRYVRLEVHANPDAELRDFQHELRACIDGEPGKHDAGLEERFLQVKRLVQRFRGRDGSVEIDQRWTRKVTDVRNWFSFSASERWREDDSEHEHYSDSAGKSGGQKEKLAYTVLAAGLACQFGRDGEEGARRIFRFAMIDEAFGRGSDESARYGLELFRRMGLQLLVVTPLQKIHIIEPFVAGLGFVHSEAGQRSVLRYLGIGEYRVERDSRTVRGDAQA